MTNLLEIKAYILNFISSNLDDAFNNKVYWIGERINVPTYPYCLLSVIAENKDKRTSHHSGDLNIISISGSGSGSGAFEEKREAITTRYKTCTITVGIYNAYIQSVYDTVDMDVAKEFAYAQIDLLEGEFEDYPINKYFSVQNISPIRQLHQVVDGGYLYRYEFDLTIGYNEANITNKDIGYGVYANINTDEPKAKIDFMVTIDGNDNINIVDNVRS